MSAEWPLIPIGDVAQLFDGPHATPKKTQDGPVFLGISSLKSGQLDLSSTEHLSEEDFAKWTRRVVPRSGDVVFSYETRIGEVAIIPEGLKCCLGRRMALLRTDSSRLLPKYLLYYFLSEEFQSFLRARTIHGSTVQRLPLKDFPTYVVRIPPIEIQRSISHILESLDDRITLLRETNATLEAIAQALFKSWFVDFDPVRAKAEGRQPQGMDAATAALFPDSFEESELGLVPKGWRVGSILDIANLLSGGTPKTDRAEYWGGDIPWASAKDVSQAANSILMSTDRTITDIGLQQSSTKMIPAYSTVVVARGATTGRMVLFGRTMAMNQTCYALASKTDTPIALYLVLKKEIDALTQKAHGSVFDTITTSTFSASRTLLIPEALLRCCESVVGPLFHSMQAGIQKAETLTQLRDTLLPRLISGQLRLPEAQAQLEA